MNENEFPKDRIRKIPISSLIIHAEEDDIIPESESIHISEEIPGAELIIAPKANHMFNTTYPELYWKMIKEFLKSCIV